MTYHVLVKSRLPPKALSADLTSVFQIHHLLLLMTFQMLLEAYLMVKSLVAHGALQDLI